MNLSTFAIALLLVGVFSQTASAVDHSLWDEVLKEVVIPDVVRKGIQFNAIDFEKLRNDADLRQKHLDYMDMLSEVDFTALPRDEAIAFLINAYNAFATDIIVTENPAASIRDIPGVFSLKKWPMNQGGVKVIASLDDVEHTFLRVDVAEQDEARIHAAVNCMSLGCPDIRDEAYTAAKLDAQLNEQTFRWLRNDQKGMRIDAADNEILVSQILGWFPNDFISTANGGQNDALAGLAVPLDFALLYATDEVKEFVAANDPSVQLIPYDWDLISA